MMKSDKIILEKTCWACPEQYDAKDGARVVGYLRLRWGYFRAHCPDVGGEVVYETDIGDSGMDGCFEDDTQREYHLNLAKEAICNWWNND